ncbi:MAG: SurA N-terminal domain-containing protein [Rickettsiales bacterium]
MMDNFRKFSNSYIIKILLGMLIVSFVYWGVSGFINGARDEYVAVVDKDEYISTESFIREKQRYLREIKLQNPSITSDQLRDMGYNNIILRDLILKKLSQVEANRLGLVISDSLVVDLIKKDKMFQNKQKKFDALRFKKILQHNKINERDYTNDIKDRMTAQLIIQAFSTPATIPDMFVDATYLQSNQKRTATIVTANPNNKIIVTDTEIKDYYQKNKKKLISPELRDIEFIYVDATHAKKRVNVTNKEINSHFNHLPKEHQTPANKKRVTDQLKAEKIDQFLLDIVQKIEADIDSNKPLKQIAAKHKVGYKKAIQVNKKNKHLPKFENFSKQVFEAEEDVVSEVQNIGNNKQGYYVFRVNKTYPARILPLNQTIRTKIKQTLVNARKTSVSRSLMAKAKNLPEGSNNYKSIKGLMFERKTFSINKPANLPQNAMSELFSLEAGKSTNIYKNNNGEYFFLRLDKIINPKLSLSKAEKSSYTTVMQKKLSRMQMNGLYKFLYDKLGVKVNQAMLNKL